MDCPSLLAAIDATGAECVWVTHGYRDPVVRWLREHGLQAQAVASRWEGESDEGDVVVAEEETVAVQDANSTESATDAQK